MSSSPVVRPSRTLFLSIFSVVVFAGITGCGVGTKAAPDPVSLTLNGSVHGGQQAVVGATVQLYAVGETGNGSAATALMATPVISVANGAFSITNDYMCPSATTQVYIVATGGNPGLGTGVNNAALAMVAALGNCGDLSSSEYITINEVTTVAAAWTLAPFIASYDSIGASATNGLGLANAFLNANLIVDTTTGTTATLPSNLTTEMGKIDALADAMASCVNSNGGSACSPLFTAATPHGGSAPTNTFDAVVNVVKNPGNNVSGVFAAAGPEPPFPTSLTQAPNDWTLSLTVTGGGINEPTQLGVDGQGNVWADDYVNAAGTSGLLSAFSPQGTPLSSTGYGSGLLSESYGLAVDPSGNVWVSILELPRHDSTSGSIVQFLGASSGADMGTWTLFSDDTIDYPIGLGADSNGNILVANNGNSSVTVVNPTANTSTVFENGTEFDGPVAVAPAPPFAPDTHDGIWAADKVDISATHIDSSGNLIATVDCCAAVDALAMDSAGNAWLAVYDDSTGQTGDPEDGSVAEIAPDGSVTQDFLTAGGIQNPSGIAVDAAQNVWVTNYLSPVGVTYQSFSELAGSTSPTPGAAISPSTGYGLDADLIEPFGLAIDASGNIWISNNGKNDLVMFFGLAAPTATPRTVTPVAP
ncbi:MAG TPA: hypothetical protein VHY48_02765 [Acidobacteriaceae bacterium]|jgi:sugar lactone lactonase YvrE|nr:hypothetical protein [Acidobacteriaceae bacterium]